MAPQGAEVGMRGWRGGLATVAPTDAERAASMPGDDLVPAPSVVMDRAFTVAGEPTVVWPWLEQLGKRRGGWYLPRALERLVPPGRRAARAVDPRWLGLRVGDVVPDYGGPSETFTVAQVEPPDVLVYSSQRRHVSVSWAITLTDLGGHTRVRLRLRLGGVRHPRVADLLGGAVDLLTIAAMAAGLRERLP